MKRPRHRRPARLLASAGIALGLGAAPAFAEIKGLEILAPASPGGGWDQTARAMQAALQQEGLASGIQVTNIPGAGGTVGLAQFVTGKGRGDAIMITGLIMVGAILTNKAPVTLDAVTPLARLTGEYELIAVPTGSPIRSMADLVAKLKADPGSVSWGGGSAGGLDHILTGLVARAVGVDPTRINYIAHSGGGEAMSSILGGHVTAGVSGVAELMPQVEAGKLRALAVSSEKRIPGIDVPTLKEQGVDVALTNWRGVMARRQLRDAEKQALSEMIARMVKSSAWQDTLKARSWLDLYQPADQFAEFLKQDRGRVEGVLKEVGLVK
jgi:putative tricarboxylic transport membrane protein